MAKKKSSPQLSSKTQNISTHPTKKINKVKASIKNKHLEDVQKSQPRIASVVGKPWSQLQFTLKDQIVESLSANNFKTMLPVQEASIPLLLKNYDLAVEAQTGSGKTLSFLIPLLEKYLNVNLKKIQEDQENNQKIHINFLLLSPTRELCQQTFSVLTKLLSKLPNKEKGKNYLKYCHCATGGNELEVDIENIKQKCYVLIGTVGRVRELSQHMDDNWLKKVDYLYIDEADRVLKEKGIEELIKSIQKLRRTAMFSATLQSMLPKHYQFYGMRNLAKISLKPINSKEQTENPSTKQKIVVNPEKAYIIPKSLHNTYLLMKDRVDKISFLVSFLRLHLKTQKTIVFFNTCASVDFYSKLFQAYFHANSEVIYGIHGKLKTNRRSKINREFLERESGVLFATDVVSRGIDFDQIHFIIQIDPPEDPDNYVHRIGRTARINRPGTAILLIESHEETFINFLAQKSVGVQEIKPEHFVGKQQTSIQTLKQQIHQIMITDRDFIEKSKKAFVSYVRSYKEHELKYIFQFKNLDIGATAHSFFLYKMPRIKEILGKNINTFVQSEFDVESIHWVDKNQEAQFLIKKEKRTEQLEEKKKQSKKHNQEDYKNRKSKRKRVKRKNQEKQMSRLNSDHKQILKSKKLGRNYITQEPESNESQVEQYNEDTEEIQKRIEAKHSKNK